ncbi:hypothetical protein ACJ73_08220 [Blastomyces percursus]|uniref:Calcineurin-like phosphoesterase domain-containing protein n=1 Tax=Blastomyces percursus TaxID=1658174 RepID=A0A1J9PVW6_9EURO|nr:hypothetical protein ACJ73_08220 [Blastomyces percursus]
MHPFLQPHEARKLQIIQTSLKPSHCHMFLTKLLSLGPQGRIRLQFVSDLHLEVGPQYATFNIVPHATHLILAGDIGRLADYDGFRRFLQSQCEKFAAVYLVLGNHEFFGVSRQEGLCLAAKLQEEPGLKERLIIMNKTRVNLQEATLLGCTLHSHIFAEVEELVQKKVNDFRRIVDWTVASHNSEHAADVEWLINEVTSIREAEKLTGSKRKIVVISHHAPSTRGTSKPSDEGNPWSSAFATDLLGNTDETSCLNDVQLWIFGHTHYSTELIIGQVKLVSNQRGYVLPGKMNDLSTKGSPSLVSKVLRSFGNRRREQHAFNPERVIEL